MSNADFDALPAIALQLALQVDRYRRAIHQLASNRADEAAASAEFAIFEMEVQGLAVTGAQRERAVELRARARALKQAIFDNGLL